MYSLNLSYGTLGKWGHFRTCLDFEESSHRKILCHTVSRLKKRVCDIESHIFSEHGKISGKCNFHGFGSAYALFWGGKTRKQLRNRHKKLVNKETGEREREREINAARGELTRCKRIPQKFRSRARDPHGRINS